MSGLCPEGQNIDRCVICPNPVFSKTYEAAAGAAVPFVCPANVRIVTEEGIIDVGRMSKIRIICR